MKNSKISMDTPSLAVLMFGQFERKHEEYLRLRKEIEDTRAEMAKVEERLRLLRQLLSLDGKQVEMPEGTRRSTA